MTHPVLDSVTAKIVERSRETRAAYLDDMHARRPEGLARKRLSAGNQAHAFAGCALHDKKELFGASWPNIGIITSYNDMLSAHQPFEAFPEIIRMAARKAGATAQVSGGVPAMCDGVTQGQTGMEMSLFSRDVIAMATAVSLSHDTYDAALYLGVCDKIVPGLLIGALQFGYLPAIFVPAGPMPSGLPNQEKQRIRQLFAEGKATREDLMKAEAESYHSPGTCTFYGTANSNQMLMEIMGLHLPGAAFVNPNTPLRKALTEAATQRAVEITAAKDSYTPIGEVVTEKSIVNAIVGLLATGGSTNHTLHIPAIARAAGIIVNWDDFTELSHITPLLTKIYPNGYADVNHFHTAGGMGLLTRELLDAGLLHRDVKTVSGGDLSDYTTEPILDGGKAVWREAPIASKDTAIISTVEKPFNAEGGVRVLAGKLGRGVVKVSAVAEQHRKVTAPARVFDDQNDMYKAFEAGELNKDVVCVVRFQGPRANGMPELHKLTPPLGVLQDKGFAVALVTDGRMSGASGKIPAAIHVGPEAASGGPLAYVQDGDIITLDAEAGVLEIDVDEAVLMARIPAQQPTNRGRLGFGRDLFGSFRAQCTEAEAGASCFHPNENARQTFEGKA
ncbi:phosphogluconate dehydratase [Fretibacter rubidus]|uniref:phosphogluconate dehydratase n=1 Tax=Fretibacter rubidus TaxID=570162 RepID=UPI00352B1A20